MIALTDFVYKLSYYEEVGDVFLQKIFFRRISHSLF